MYCKRCNYENYDGVNFCIRCGAPIQQNYKLAQRAPYIDNSALTKKFTNKQKLAIGFLVIVIAVIMTIMIINIKSNNDEEIIDELTKELSIAYKEQNAEKIAKIMYPDEMVDEMRLYEDDFFDKMKYSEISILSLERTGEIEAAEEKLESEFIKEMEKNFEAYRNFEIEDVKTFEAIVGVGGMGEKHKFKVVVVAYEIDGEWNIFPYK